MARLTKTLLSLRVSWTPRRSAWCARRLPRRARRRRRHLCQTPHRRPRRRTTRPPSWPRSKRAPPRRAWSRSVGVLAPRRALAGEAGPCPPGPGAREGYIGQPPARVLAQVLSRARGLWRPGSRVGSSDVLDAFNAEVVKRQKKEAGEGGTRVLLYSDIRKWLPEWARTGPRDVEEAADASCSASKEIRDLAKARPARVDGFGSPGRGRLPSRKSRR